VLRQARLVVDVNLPDISGLELLQLLQADPGWHDPPVVLVSAKPWQPAIAEALTRVYVRRGSLASRHD
jgi:CheY-like chemotaxis protein